MSGLFCCFRSNVDTQNKKYYTSNEVEMKKRAITKASSERILREDATPVTNETVIQLINQQQSYRDNRLSLVREDSREEGNVPAI